MKKTAKWSVVFLGLSFLALIITAVTVIVIDPFFQYHKPLPGFPYLLENQLTQNPGMAKNLDYDSVLLGSSMTLNFDTSWFEEEFGEKTIKLTYNAAFPKDQDNILKLIEKHPGELKTVFLGMDLLTYSGGVDTTAYPIRKCYYDNNLLNDAEYWWNLDVLLTYIIKPILQGEEGDDFHNIYNKYYDASLYDEKKALAAYTPSPLSEEKKPEDCYLAAVTENMTRNILPYIERNPDTEFVCFFPPYSMLFWNDRVREQDVEARIAQYSCMIEALFRYDNVEVYFFPGDTELISDLNHYKDYTHYDMDTCRYLTKCMASGKWRVTKENYVEILEEFYEYVTHFDYSSWGL